MKNKQIPIPKGQSVSFILAVIFFLIVLKINGQSKFEGTYCINYTLKDIYTCITFYEKGTFEYKTGGDLGNTFYGNGFYQFKNNFLKLDFNKTDTKDIGYHNSSFWKNEKDSISINFNIASAIGEAIAGANVIVLSEKTGATSDEKGNSTINLRKTEENYKFTVSCLGFDTYEFFLDGNYNYQVSIVLQTFEPGIPIKDQVMIFEILEFSDQLIKTKNGNGRDGLWERVER